MTTAAEHNERILELLGAVPDRPRGRRAAFAAAVTAALPGLRGAQRAAVAELPPAVLWRAARATWAATPAVQATGLVPPTPPTGFRRTLPDLIPEIAAASVLRVPTFTPPATAGTPHAEGAAKTEAVMTFGPGRDVPLRSVASVVTVTDELLDDAPQFAAWLDVYLEFLVALGEERQVLLGDGVAPNLLGYRAWPGIVTHVPTATTIGGKLAGAAAAVAVNSGGLEADTYVISAADYALLVEEDVLDAEAAVLHGRALIHTPVLAAGQMLVGAVQTASVLGRNGGITVEGTQSHDLTFISNLSTLRAASRLALGVIQPSAFVKVG
jgi:HK97 family phage major capsid protein